MLIHPFTGFCLWLWYSVSAMLVAASGGHLWLALMALLPLAALLWDSNGRQRLRWLSAVLLPLALGLWLIHSQILGYWLGYQAQWQWPWHAAALWLQIAICLLAAQCWLRQCPLPQLINALLCSNFPASFSYLLAAPLLLLDPIKRQLQQIRMAQLARGVPLDGNLWQRFCALPSMVMPLLSGLLNGVSQRSAILEQRGFRSQASRSRWNAPVDSAMQRLARRLLLLLLPLQAALLWLVGAL